MRWFRERENGARVAGKKPKYTPYTQRALGGAAARGSQNPAARDARPGHGPADGARRVPDRARSVDTHRLDENLIEVYPKATLTQLFARAHRGRATSDRATRRRRGCEILNALDDLASHRARGASTGLANDHKFDAVICAYTAYLWSRGACLEPTNATVRDDGWIWFPEKQA